MEEKGRKTRETPLDGEHGQQPVQQYQIETRGRVMFVTYVTSGTERIQVKNIDRK